MTNMNMPTRSSPQVIMMRRDPDARPDPVQDHVARHFEEEVADEEDAGAEAVDRFAEAQVLSICSLAKPTLTRSR